MKMSTRQGVPRRPRVDPASKAPVTPDKESDLPRLRFGKMVILGQDMFDFLSGKSECKVQIDKTYILYMSLTWTNDSHFQCEPPLTQYNRLTFQNKKIYLRVPPNRSYRYCAHCARLGHADCSNPFFLKQAPPSVNNPLDVIKSTKRKKRRRPRNVTFREPVYISCPTTHLTRETKRRPAPKHEAPGRDASKLEPIIENSPPQVRRDASKATIVMKTLAPHTQTAITAESTSTTSTASAYRMLTTAIPIDSTVTDSIPNINTFLKPPPAYTHPKPEPQISELLPSLRAMRTPRAASVDALQQLRNLLMDSSDDDYCSANEQ